ncbi:MAG: aminodeoxychorismate/anthranilate synthase component II [Selenomonadaceae bacterium]|nr:aminodeoxychorismate/anthranilate synthase component II [Selenomonadaceae bacterium]MBR0284884.1 aminodeoxychorismate/anthranilate synthase component II [Selenomonadaceae bacterium]MBR6342665.1 aminodeoxychorismate/anthranilate synthase component II [Selenomonadaceae bacterium]MBR6710713.1 aminodeoxychorismate/anthranilate synthase component II [Selenomonadaceae bacterium]MBR6905608.1 aminodeoxychorismate/anthranilate synthase component II [Selenomonadaceae bacterium]
MILLIDNYDSFSYNLYQLVGELDASVRVIRNDEMTISDIRDMKPERILISPGPGRPENAGIILEVAKGVDQIPILGVCLGHQAICSAFGARITYARQLMHGKQSEVELDADCPIFRNCPGRTLVARYHSLAVDEDTMPDCLKITARTAEGEIMAVQHRDSPIYGMQFHPESIMTPAGKQMLENFVRNL